MGPSGVNAPLSEGPNIAGVQVTPLTQVADERGNLMHMLRSDSFEFQSVGEVYFSRVKRGAVKAWKRHRRIACRLAVPLGMVRFVLYDIRPESMTRGQVQTVLTGSERYGLIKIPTGIWYGFRGEGPGESLIADCPTLRHDPEEIDRLPADTMDIPFSWAGTPF